MIISRLTPASASTSGAATTRPGPCTPPATALSPGYYRAAIAHIRAQTPGARLFVFSDEIDWAKVN